VIYNRQKGRPIHTKQFEIALSTFEKLRAAFPALSMEYDLQPANMELAVDIPAQAGLSFPVFLNLQNLDELCLETSALGVSWFPCTNPQKVENHFEAVSGLLSGRFRILQHWRGKRVVKAELQQPKRGLENCHWLFISVVGAVATKDV
jgi:hypothetical protein